MVYTWRLNVIQPKKEGDPDTGCNMEDPKDMVLNEDKVSKGHACMIQLT